MQRFIKMDVSGEHDHDEDVVHQNPDGSPTDLTGWSVEAKLTSWERPDVDVVVSDLVPSDGTYKITIAAADLVEWKPHDDYGKLHLIVRDSLGNPVEIPEIGVRTFT